MANCECFDDMLFDIWRCPVVEHCRANPIPTLPDFVLVRRFGDEKVLELAFIECIQNCCSSVTFERTVLMVNPLPSCVEMAEEQKKAATGVDKDRKAWPCSKNGCPC